MLVVKLKYEIENQRDFTFEDYPITFIDKSKSLYR